MIIETQAKTILSYCKNPSWFDIKYIHVIGLAFSFPVFALPCISGTG